MSRTVLEHRRFRSAFGNCSFQTGFAPVRMSHTSNNSGLGHSRGVARHPPRSRSRGAERGPHDRSAHPHRTVVPAVGQLAGSTRRGRRGRRGGRRSECRCARRVARCAAPRMRRTAGTTAGNFGAEKLSGAGDGEGVGAQRTRARRHRPVGAGRSAAGPHLVRYFGRCGAVPPNVDGGAIAPSAMAGARRAATLVHESARRKRGTGRPPSIRAPIAGWRCCRSRQPPRRR